MKLLNKAAMIFGTLLFAIPALAEGDVPHFALQSLSDGNFLGLMGLGAGLGVGLAAAGAGMGQGRAASAALDGIARNPSATNKMFVPLVLSLALMESLVIFSFLVTNGIAGTIKAVLLGQ